MNREQLHNHACALLDIVPVLPMVRPAKQTVEVQERAGRHQLVLTVVYDVGDSDLSHDPRHRPHPVALAG